MIDTINLDNLIQQMFPSSAFPVVDEQTLVYLYRAYSIGFKDGFSRSHSDVKIQRESTLGERLYAAEQEES